MERESSWVLLLQHKKDGSVFSKPAVSNPSTASSCLTFVRPVHSVRAAQMQEVEHDCCDPHVSRWICSQNQGGECMSVKLLRKHKYQFTPGLAFPAPVPPFAPIRNNNGEQRHRDILFGQSALKAKGALSIF